MIGRHMCARCKNFIKYGEKWKPYCKAFPKGIPLDFYDKIEPWNIPKDCNNGIGFEPEEEDEKESSEN